MYYRYKDNSFKRFERGGKMREELYQKEIKDLTQNELYEILIDCGINSIQKVGSGQGGIIFLDDNKSNEEIFETKNQTIFTYYEILDKLEFFGDNKIEYEFSNDQYVNYTLLNDYRVA